VDDVVAPEPAGGTSEGADGGVALARVALADGEPGIMRRCLGEDAPVPAHATPLAADMEVPDPQPTVIGVAPGRGRIGAHVSGAREPGPLSP
jgi:hypothetical protein